MLSSWSTSLNLIFLSLAWTTMAATYSPLQLELFGPIALRLTLYILPSLIFLTFDIGVPSLAVEFKAHGKWGIATNQRGGKRKLRRVVLWSVGNVMACVVLQAAIEWVVTDVLRMKSLLLIKGSRWGLNHLPNPWTMVKHALAGVLAHNVLQYYIHTHLLHSPSGGRLADWHANWHHSVQVPYSFVANYDHPVCHAVHRWLPLYLPAVALRMHILTYLLLIAFFSLEETFVYSGYNVLPSTIMIRGMARRTDAHMLSEGDGNYGSVGILDWCHGTTLGKDVMEDLKAEMEKHDAEEKTGRVIDGAGDAVSGLAARIKSKARKGRSRK
ncbi:sterol desaturase family [Didymella exigua CBS 183.55]|uniref:Sterol desaturase family n=1 Tax=Didymella exigua CBS 183.55 TaxID=1150837 RepID=A0A6A5RHR0_9PLEO|nr:sterol desaturase family [Didymella exigua CBS 183.55]KAF1927861.1 sterol desaturase family [Didymella exigua CBS 183.55]